MTEIIYIPVDRQEDLDEIKKKYGHTSYFSIRLNITRSGLKVTIEGDDYEIKAFIEELKVNSIL